MIERAPRSAGARSPTLGFADLDQSWFEPFHWLPILPENPAHFGIPLEFLVATQDGRFASRIATVLFYRAHKSGGLERVWTSYSVGIAPGDTGGWATDLADIGTVRHTRLLLGWPSDLSLDERIELLGPPGPAVCDSATRTCAGEPGHPVVRAPSPILRSGTIE